MKHWFSDLSAFRRDPLNFFLERGTRARLPFVELAMGFAPVFLVADPAFIKPIMKAGESAIDKGRLIHKLKKLIGQSSMVLSGERHRERRAIIHQQLARGMACSYVPQISAVIRQHVIALLHESVFDAHAVMAPLALQMISTILFGADVLSRGDENALVEAVLSIEDDLAADMFKIQPEWPWVKREKKRKLARARQVMSLVVNRSLDKANSSSLLSSLQTLKLTSEELADEILLLLLAGHHTTGSAAAWLLYHLATNPPLCDEIAKEARRISNNGGEVRADQLPTATISLGAVYETLRLYPSAYWLSREAKRAVEFGGMRFRRGTSFIMSAWHLHRDARYWKRPEQFDIHRAHMKNPAFIPFGAGPRACVGMGLGVLELQLLALEFSAALEIRLLSPIPAPPPKASVTLIPPPIELQVSLRGHASAGARGLVTPVVRAG